LLQGERRGVVKLVFPYVPSGKLAENQRRRMHWGSYATLLAEERDKAYGYILESLDGERPHYEKVRLTTQFFFKKKGKAPDFENIVARMKVVVDVVVALGILDDDNWEVIVEHSVLAPQTGQEADRLIITIEEAKP
jgi:Holliday junction resolvase RusA-like endonuclease